jgi:pimeloyl-ACP methyl ester carboxylesterase
MQTTSADGTRIAFDRTGAGPALILIDAALCRRGIGPNAQLAQRLRERFTVLTYDRRGRGESTDYAIRREIDDLAALIDVAGGTARLYGISSGGALALEAAARLGDRVDRVAVFEVPLRPDILRANVPDDFGTTLDGLLDADRRGQAVKLFMRQAAHVPAPLVALMPLFRNGWRQNKQLAHALRYDLAVMQGDAPAAARWAAVSAPSLVMSGGKSPAWIRDATARLAEVLPNARHRVLDGQRHYVKADALAPVLADFLTAELDGATPAVAAANRREVS